VKHSRGESLSRSSNALFGAANKYAKDRIARLTRTLTDLKTKLTTTDIPGERRRRRGKRNTARITGTGIALNGR